MGQSGHFRWVTRVMGQCTLTRSSYIEVSTTIIGKWQQIEQFGLKGLT